VATRNTNDKAKDYNRLGMEAGTGRFPKLELTTRMSDEDPYLHYIEGLILLHEGHSTAARDELETAAEMGFPTAMIAAEPHLASLRGSARFRTLVAGSR
jgi:hypothetical protein